MRGLYAIVDATLLGARGLPVVEVARAIIEARPAVLQLRAKDLPPRATLELLRTLAPVCREAGVPFFANDRPDLAVLSGCDGVHVGQTDLPISAIRKIAPGLAVGVSTHNASQLEAALSCHPDYVALGPIFPTRSKANPDEIVGLDTLERACESANVPVVAIGGIDLATAPSVARAGALGAAISALVPDDIANDWSRITARARAMHLALSSSPKHESLLGDESFLGHAHRHGRR